MPKFTPTQLKEEMLQTVAAFKSDPTDWLRFLDSAAHLYKYDFASQVMIYNQRPDATACAELPLWGNRFHRKVKRGSSGIGIVSQRFGKEQVRYVFDISDTAPRDENTLPPYIWKLRHDITGDVLKNLQSVINEDTSYLPSFAENLYVTAIVSATQHVTKQADDVHLLRAATLSTAWCVLRRCGIDPAPFIKRVPLEHISPENMHLLGNIVQQSSETVLRSIEQTVKQADRAKLFQVNMPKSIAKSAEKGYNANINNQYFPYVGGIENERNDKEQNSRSAKPQGNGRKDIPRSDTGTISPVRNGAAQVHQASGVGALSGVLGKRQAEQLSQQHRGRGERGMDTAGLGVQRKSGITDEAADQNVPAASFYSVGNNQLGFWSEVCCKWICIIQLSSKCAE